MRKKISKKVTRMIIKALTGMLMVQGSYMSITNPLQAAIISTNTHATNGIAQVKVKDTIVTITSITKENYKGKYKLGYTLERAGGIPSNTTDTSVVGNIDFSMQGKKYQLNMWGNDSKVLRISDTKVQGEVVAECSSDGGRTLVDLQLAQMNEKAATLTIKQVSYSHITNLYTYDLVNDLKKAKKANSVPYAKGNLVVDYDKAIAGAPTAEIKEGLKELKDIELKTRPKNVLPAKGLDLQILSEDLGLKLDNVGFVDDKLHMRITGFNKKSAWNLSITNASGIDTQDYLILDKTHNVFYCVYKIKNAEELAKCNIHWNQKEIVQTDQETKSVALTINIGK